MLICLFPQDDVSFLRASLLPVLQTLLQYLIPSTSLRLERELPTVQFRLWGALPQRCQSESLRSCRATPLRRYWKSWRRISPENLRLLHRPWGCRWAQPDLQSGTPPAWGCWGLPSSKDSAFRKSQHESYRCARWWTKNPGNAVDCGNSIAVGCLYNDSFSSESFERSELLNIGKSGRVRWSHTQILPNGGSYFFSQEVLCKSLIWKVVCRNLAALTGYIHMNSPSKAFDFKSTS